MKAKVACNKCNKAFNNKGNCVKHIRTHHPLEEGEDKDKQVKYRYTTSEEPDKKWERYVYPKTVYPKTPVVTKAPINPPAPVQQLNADIEDTSPPEKYRPFPKLDDMANYSLVTGFPRNNLPKPMQIVEERAILEQLAWYEQDKKKVHELHQRKVYTLGKAQEELRQLENTKAAIDRRIASSCKKGT
jgi:hypothetical protein